jgi:H+/gluconate symporter-like permease
VTLEWLGLLGGLGLLIWLTMRGVDLLIAAPVCALLVALSAGLALFPQTAVEGAPSFTAAYMGGFTGFFASWFFVFLLGAIFGKLMEDSGAADSVAQWVVGRFGAKHALLAVIGACAVLTYGGVSLFVVAFSVFPLALALFKQAGLPRRFIPGTIAFGSVTFTMTSAGSPEIQNWIPIEFLGTTPYAAWQVSLLVAVAMAVGGYLWLRGMLRGATARGETFDVRDSDPMAKTGGLPHPATGLVPLAAVLVVAFIFHDRFKQSALILALLAGVLAVLLVNRRYFVNLRQAVTDGALGSLIAIANTCAVVGFGAIAKLSPAFGAAVDALTHLPGDPLLGAAAAVTLIAGLTGSASGGQAIALPIIAPHYLEQGVDPAALHRVVAIASGGLDSLPHNGYVVTTIRAVCRESHASAYGPVFCMTVVVPLAGLALALLLFSLAA